MQRELAGTKRDRFHSGRQHGRQNNEPSTRQLGQAMRSAAEQTVALAKMTPHRVMRELYEQTIAYWRAYADSLADIHSAPDNHLALVANARISCCWFTICAAIELWLRRCTRALASTSDLHRRKIAPIGDPAEPQTVSRPAPAEPDLRRVVGQLRPNSLTTLPPGASIDTNIPASQWTPEQRSP